MKEIVKKICYILKRNNTIKNYNLFKKREYLSLKENLKFQEDRLKKILAHSWKNVPYYSRILEESGVVINGEVNINNFEKIPILTKDIIRKEGKNLYSNDYLKRKHFINTSGGSTGVPVRLVQDKFQKEENIAMAWLQNSFICDMPHKIVKLWGSERDILNEKESFENKFMNWLFDTKLLNSFRLSNEKMKEYVNTINSLKPDIVEAYVQSVYEFAVFLKNNNIKIFSPKGVITSAGTLYPHMKKTIEDVFGCRVYNRYGSREVSTIACSCEKNNGLHLNILTNYTEILNDSLKACLPEEDGEVYITTLNNFSMPLIRYKIGDMVMVAKNNQCSCGRGMPLIKKIIGRQMEVFKTKDGKIIPGEFFIHFIGVVYNNNAIKQFQVIQKGYNNILIKAILENKENFLENKINIENAIKKVMGSKCIIIWKFVDKIEPTKSGKYLYTISELN